MTGWLWLSFLVLIGTLAVLDLGVITRRPRTVRPADALPTMALWLLAAAAFSFFLTRAYDVAELRAELSFPITGVPIKPANAWFQFITAYVVELVLSLDNIAVMALIVRHFGVASHLIPRLLFFGVLVSLVLRWVLIALCSEAMRVYPAMHYVLGGVLVLAMLRMLAMPTARSNLDRRWTVRLVRRILPHIRLLIGARSESAPARKSAPLLLTILIVCILDLTYAADSIPALFAITQDPFIAFTASAFALLALRSLYLALSSAVSRFRFLRLALVLVLLLIAAKMFTGHYLLWETGYMLAGVVTIVSLAAIASGIWNRFWPRPVRTAPAPAVAEPTPLEDLADAVLAARRNFRKVVILIAGTFVIITGIAIAPLPGPGPTILVPIGLALLATEFIWARRLLNTVKSGAFSLSDRADRWVDKRGWWVIPVGIVAFWATTIGVMWGIFRLEWYVIAVVAGSPFMPVALWALNYARKYRIHGRGYLPARPVDPSPDHIDTTERPRASSTPNYTACSDRSPPPGVG